MVNLASIISKKSPDNFFNQNGYEGYFDKYPGIGLVVIKVIDNNANRRFSETFNLKSDNYHIKIANYLASFNPSPLRENESLEILAERIKFEIKLS